MTGLTVAQINELTQRLRDLATRAERHKCRAEWHRAAEAQANSATASTRSR